MCRAQAEKVSAINILTVINVPNHYAYFPLFSLIAQDNFLDPNFDYLLVQFVVIRNADTLLLVAEQLHLKVLRMQFHLVITALLYLFVPLYFGQRYVTNIPAFESFCIPRSILIFPSKSCIQAWEIVHDIMHHQYVSNFMISVNI